MASGPVHGVLQLAHLLRATRRSVLTVSRCRALNKVCEFEELPKDAQQLYVDAIYFVRIEAMSLANSSVRKQGD